MPTRRTFLLTSLVALGIPAHAGAQGFPGGLGEAFGSRFAPRPTLRDLARRRRRPGAAVIERLRHWSETAVDASGLDHTPPAPGENRLFGEQLGPGRASRAMAIVHVAVFDAMNAVLGGYHGYAGLPAAPDNTSVHAAIAVAAHDALVAVFPSQENDLDAALTDDLADIPDTRAKTNGVTVGRQAAAAILARRQNDGSDHDEPRVGIEFIPGNAPGDWRQDPISQLPLALGALWGDVRPFVLRSGEQFRVPPPPPLDSAAYAKAFAEVKALGGDGETTATVRTDDQTLTGIFWAYDGTPSLCAPPRLYNQIALHIAGQMGSGPMETARLLALAHLTMADAGIAIWESKYHYELWRPVTGIRESDQGTGPRGAGDGNSATVGDPKFSPLGAPASNLNGPNFTPPFPAYPSGHAGFGGALFQVLRHVYRTDRIRFTLVSDELNGETVDNEGHVRPRLPRTFSSLSQAEEESGQSRIYLGIHWAFDKTAGIAQGRRIADYVVARELLPRSR